VNTLKIPFIALIAFVLCLLAGGLLWGQATQKQTELNDMPYAEVKATLSTPQKRAELIREVKENHVILMGGRPIVGRHVAMVGEFTGADCYLSAGMHGMNHALCAKACVIHGSPILFLSQKGTVYVVLPPKDGDEVPVSVLNDLGRPGVTAVGDTLYSHGIHAFSVHSATP
jgi:hypothetical protein